jgi:subtilisin family serine protease
MLFLIFLLLISPNIYAEKYRVFFKDKGEGEFYKGTTLFQLAENSISERSKTRRAKIFPKDSLVTSQDVPINPEYIKTIASQGAEIKLKLKWLNYIVIEIDSQKISKIQSLPFVKFVQKISNKVPRELLFNSVNQESKIDLKKEIFLNIAENLQYGESYNQLRMLAIDKLHSYGIFGEDVLLGILDSGFRWKTHKGLKNSNVVAEFDFLNNDTITGNEANDVPSQDGHGTMVFSIIAGFSPGKLIGSAPFANFALAKTESIPFESHFEEDCFASALEWFDSLGVDVVTSSLGYSQFDSTEISYNFDELDGKTTLVSAYANFAKRLGICLVASAGNKGPRDSTIQAPAEALSEIAIGAIAPTGDTVLKFSSRGPTADGRIKPDFLAQGKSVISFSADNPDTLLYGSGTSVASPLFAGGVVCLLSAFEELIPDTVISLLKSFASNKEHPNNTLGWGIPDFFASAINYDILISNPITYSINNRQRIIFKAKYIYPIRKVNLFLKGESESDFKLHEMNYSEYYDLYYFDLNPNTGDSIFQYFVVAQSTDGRERRKPFYQNKTFVLKMGMESSNVNTILDTNYIRLSFFASENSSILYPTLLESSGELYFDTPTINSDWIKVAVVSLLGEVVFEKKFKTLPNRRFSDRLNLGSLPKGAYLFLIFRNEGNPDVLKFVKIY